MIEITRGRTRDSQSKHDREVYRIARSYEGAGYRVWADVPGFPHPWMIGRHVPDVIAVKGGHTTIVEVETEDSVGTARDVEQRAAFEMWASQDPRARRFEWMVV